MAAVSASRRLSDTQAAVLRAMARLAGDRPLEAREIGAVTGQSSDGAAYTLRSLVRRGLVEVIAHDGERSGYALTQAGRESA